MSDSYSGKVISVNMGFLKLAAVVTMLMDHVGLLWEIDVLRAIGRMAFPLFAFCFIQGFLHTHDRMAYCYKLMQLAVFSQVPYMLLKGEPLSQLNLLLLASAVVASLFSTTTPLGFTFSVFMQGSELNVLYLFVWTLWVLSAYELKREKQAAGGLIMLSVVGGVFVMARADYTLMGAILLLFLYKYRENSTKQGVVIMLWSLLVYGLGTTDLYMVLGGIVAGVFVMLYDNAEYRMGKIIKRMYWSFYPVHMLVLWFVHEYGAKLLDWYVC